MPLRAGHAAFKVSAFTPQSLEPHSFLAKRNVVEEENDAAVFLDVPCKMSGHRYPRRPGWVGHQETD